MLNVNNGVLSCPICKGEHTHLDDVYVAGRAREDGDVIPVHVDSAGHVRQGSQVSLPSADVGRRHAITVAGWCEECGIHFGIEFKQHKGLTEVKVLRKAWQAVTT